MASSVELEVTSVPAVTDAGAVVRLAAEIAPTKTEAQASKGYVNLSIEAGSTRKFSISQHYGSNFEDGGFTLADVLTPNTSYKLYLYTPSAIDLGQTVIKGGEIKGDRVEISFTTASLPAAGDAVWSEQSAAGEAGEYVASLNEYHFMEGQTGVIAVYFESPYIPFLLDFTSDLDGVIQPLGRYDPSRNPVSISGANAYFNIGLVAGYPSTAASQIFYMITADKGTTPILQGLLKSSRTPQSGPAFTTRHKIFRY
ncbi:hypothetical protein P0082_03875 [Candidatus Haliotispira prima]|uniref:Uncharacterized protein n=1 Tax=Candidatus Haliotispira prima TaxID=3034016 RepID=A0ABY8MJ16_9SPIO|nr:hypothetical protein P0082_03875 [Candidatus Haliotispira prima]